MKINLQFNALNLNALNSKKHDFHIREELCYERRQKIKYDTTKSMNKTSTYRGTSQRAGLGGNRYEGLYGMDLGDAR